MHPRHSQADKVGFQYIFLLFLCVSLSPSAFVLRKFPQSAERGITCHHGHMAEPCKLQWWARCSGGLSEQFAKPFISLIREQMDCLLLKAVGSLGSTIASDFWPARGLGKNPCPEPHFPDEEPEVRRDKWLVRAAGPHLLGKPARFWWCGRAGQLTRKKPKPSHNSSNFLLSHVYHHSYIVTGYKYNST